MNRLYDTVEPTVIDEELLKTCIEEQGPPDEAGKIAKKEGIDFSEVKQLRLDFKNVLKIDNLWFFTNLVKLNLDNNIIEKIQHLDSLIHLEWLDLSFNNIEKIEGLDKLTKLKDLTLYNNQITMLENMDELTNLHVFSIGNNNLSQIDNIIYLRKFKQLKCLNVAGNPFSEKDYKSYVIAHLPAITYLDFRLVSGQMREEAVSLYQDAIDVIEHNERDEQKKIEKEKARIQEDQQLREAFVDGLTGSSLFNDMFSEDADGPKLNMLTQMEEAYTHFKTKFCKICEELVKYGLKEHENREKEKALFMMAINKAKEADKQQGVKTINEFLSFKKRVITELGQISDPRVLETKINELQEERNNVWDVLMGYELQLAEQLEEVGKDFERTMNDMTGTFTETVQNYFTQCRELENMHHEKLTETALLIMEKVVKNELEEELPEDLRMLFVDKDTITNGVNTSHDLHLLKIDNKEDDIVTRVGNTKESYNARLHEEEIRRNRSRVAEINHFLENVRDELEQYENLDR